MESILYLKKKKNRKQTLSPLLQLYFYKEAVIKWFGKKSSIEYSSMN